MEREKLLNNLVGKSKIDSMKAGIQPLEGGVITLSQNARMEAWIDQQFGQFGVKVVGVPEGAENLKMNDITAIGGWCAIRTADRMQLQQGIIVDPLSGTPETYTEVGKVAEWMQRAISIDQIVEAIGMYEGSNFTAISEEKLWGDRVKTDIEGKFRRRLTSIEVVQLDDAMLQAEERRYETTKRYLSYATGRDINLMRVVDRDIYPELVQVRDDMLDIAGISLKELLERYPEESSTRGYSIVWGMYTGPYLALLKAKGYVQTSNGLIVEPWMHAVSETRSKRLVNERVFGRRGYPYLEKGGVNQDLGFVAYADVMLPNGQRLRQSTPISGVPNQENYQQFIDQLRDNRSCASLTLSENPAFIWGTNLLPFGQTKDVLLRMIQAKDEYKQEKAAVTVNAQNREEASSQARQLKTEYSLLMEEQAQRVISELEKMLRFVFDRKELK